MSSTTNSNVRNIDEEKYNKMNLKLSSYSDYDLACILYLRFKNSGSVLMKEAFKIQQAIENPSSYCSWSRILPISMYREIQKYLSAGEYWKLMITSNQLFEKIRFETRILKLSHLETLDFLKDENVRLSYLNKVANPFNQLKIIGRYFSYRDFLTLCSLVKCDLDVAFSDSDGILTLEEMNDLISLLSNRRRITMHSYTLMKDFNGLTGVEKMDICNLPSLVSVDGLKNLYSLTIQSCPNVTDFSCLGNLHELHIISCIGITKAIGLGNISYLSLENLVNLIDLDPLMMNKKLEIVNCKNVIDHSPLRNVHELITDLIISFQDCDNLLQGNERLNSITLIGYQEKEPHPGLSRMKSVSLIRSSIVSLKYLKDIPYLSFSFCPSLSDVSFIAGSTKIKSISFNYCNEMSDYTSLHGIPSIRIHTGQPGVIHSFYPMDQLSDTRYLYFGCNIPEFGYAIGMRGLTNVKHMVVKNMLLRHLPTDIEVLEFLGQDFNGAQTIIEDVMSPKIILKEGVYAAFMKELEKLPKFICDSSSPYELFDDPIAKQAVLLKNIRYQKPKNGPNMLLVMLDKFLYLLFGIVPPPRPKNSILHDYLFNGPVENIPQTLPVFGVSAPAAAPAPAPRWFLPGIPVANIPQPVNAFGVTAPVAAPAPGWFLPGIPVANIPQPTSAFGVSAPAPAPAPAPDPDPDPDPLNSLPGEIPAFGPVHVDSDGSDDSFPPR